VGADKQKECEPNQRLVGLRMVGSMAVTAFTCLCYADSL